jgi:hypothetical protein
LAQITTHSPLSAQSGVDNMMVEPQVTQSPIRQMNNGCVIFRLLMPMFPMLKPMLQFVGSSGQRQLQIRRLTDS